MNPTNRIVEALNLAQPHELLSAFVVSFNDQSTQLEEVTDQRDQLERMNVADQHELTQLREQLAQQAAEIASCHEAARKAEKIATQAVALQVEKTKLQEQLAQTQQALTALRGAGDPEKLKEKVKRLQDNNATKEARIGQLERDLEAARHAVGVTQRQAIEAHTKIDQLQRQLAHDTGSGLYHNGEHHLIIWPQKTKMQRPDGSTLEARSLLYMHQSGRGALFTYNEQDGTLFAPSPKPGLKPTKEVQEFAHNWLFKVNSLQGGVVHESDMVPVDFNGYGREQVRDAA